MSTRLLAVARVARNKEIVAYGRGHIACWQLTPCDFSVRAGCGRIGWKPAFRIGGPVDFPWQLVLNKAHQGFTEKGPDDLASTASPRSGRSGFLCFRLREQRLGRRVRPD